MRPNPGKQYQNRPFSHLHPKKHKPPMKQHHQKYKPEPDRAQKLENMQVDIIPNTIEYLLSRNYFEDGQASMDFNLLESASNRDLPSYILLDDPTTAVLDQRLDSYDLKNRLPTCMTWTPNGKRLLVGNSKGKVSVMEGSTFSMEYELNIQAAGKSLKTISMTRKSRLLLVGDEEGVIKYLDSNYKEVREVRASPTSLDGIRDISISSTDLKFVTAGEKDKTLRIWDLEKGIVEKDFVHGNEINCCQFHPFQGLIASGSKDSTIKFWDPNSGEELASLINHTNSINCIKWNANGNWLLSCARDQSIRMYDIRMVKEIQAFTGIDSEVEVVSWNPFHEKLFTSGTKEGGISFWLAHEPNPISDIKYAHFTEKKELGPHDKRGGPPRGGRIVELVWNPVGDVLASCGNDKTIKLWGRPKDNMRFTSQIEEVNMDQQMYKDIADMGEMEDSYGNEGYNQY